LDKPLKWDTIIFMVVVHILALIALLPQFWSTGSVLSLLILYWVTACLGVTLGYHRLLSHRSFKVPQWLERFFATCGSLSAEFGPIQWVGLHRQHHKYSDTDKDPHDIHKGFWWSHILWMFFECPGEEVIPNYTKDLTKDPYYVWLDKYFLALQVPLGLVLYLLGGWSFVLWGIFLRLAVVYQVTWLVNSAAHTWGTQPHDSKDNSRNSLWVALLTFGEGWHNNHHAFPSSAKHGLGENQLDITWLHIIILERLGLATNIRLN
jgi:stearoyl-CoA desaturase (delta-9 desaturase)